MTDVEEASATAGIVRAAARARAGDLPGAEADCRAALTAAAALLDAGQVAAAEAVFRAAREAGIDAATAGLALCLRARGATAEMGSVIESGLAGGVTDAVVRDLLIDLAPADGSIAVTGIHFGWKGDRLALACGRCGRTWEEELPSWMCSLPVACAACGAATRLEPEALAAAAARLDPPLPVPVADALDAGVARLLAQWHQAPALAIWLAVGGVNVGAAAEHALVPVALDAVVAIYRETP